MPDDKEEEKEIEVPNEPEVAKSIGFFLDNWIAKSFRSPPSKSVSKTIESASVSVSVDMSKVVTNGMVTVNYGYARYGTSEKPVEAGAHLAAEWVRYDKRRSKYWEIGNESSGPWQVGFKIDLSLNSDNQPEIVSGAMYGKHFKVFVDSMRKAATEIGVQIEIGAQLVAKNATNSWNVPDRNWNSTYFAEAGDAADFYIVHDYYDPLGSNSSAAIILNAPLKRTEEIMEWMKTTTQTGKVSLKPIALTE